MATQSGKKSQSHASKSKSKSSTGARASGGSSKAGGGASKGKQKSPAARGGSSASGQRSSKASTGKNPDRASPAKSRGGQPGRGKSRSSGGGTAKSATSKGPQTSQDKKGGAREANGGGGSGGGGGGGGGVMKRAAGRVRESGSKAVDTAKQHPIATAVLGAGIAAGAAMLTARAVRNASSGSSPQESADGPPTSASRVEDQSEDQGDQGAFNEGGDEDDEGESESDDDDDDDDEARFNSEDPHMRRRGQQEYDEDENDDEGMRGDADDGGEAGEPFWKEHPLLVASALAVLGIAAGMALPVSQAERNLTEAIPGNWPRRLKRSTRTFLKEGRGLATRLVDETTSAASDAAAEVGLTPDKLARKVRKVAQRVQSAATQVFAE